MISRGKSRGRSRSMSASKAIEMQKNQSASPGVVSVNKYDGSVKEESSAEVSSESGSESSSSSSSSSN